MQAINNRIQKKTDLCFGVMIHNYDPDNNSNSEIENAGQLNYKRVWGYDARLGTETELESSGLISSHWLLIHFLGL